MQPRCTCASPHHHMNTHLMYMVVLSPQCLVPDRSTREYASCLALYAVMAMTEAVMVATIAATPTRGRHLYASRYRGLMRKNIMSLLWRKESSNRGGGWVRPGESGAVVVVVVVVVVPLLLLTLVVGGAWGHARSRG
jgi:hypothetical protein